MRRELLGVLDEIEADPTARVVILTGAGGHFCSGGDVKTMRARHTAAEGRGRVEMLNKMVLRLVSFPLPTIAMVDGYAVGAGAPSRSEEHTSELQSRLHLVCRLLLEKKKRNLHCHMMHHASD